MGLGAVGRKWPSDMLCSEACPADIGRDNDGAAIPATACDGVGSAAMGSDPHGIAENSPHPWPTESSGRHPVQEQAAIRGLETSHSYGVTDLRLIQDTDCGSFCVS